LLRDVFAEVHMLSHLVGAANRADIRRLRLLEEENAELEAKVARQHQQLCSAVVSRDATIQELRRALEVRIVHERDGGRSQPAEPDQRVLADLAGDLKRRLTTAQSRNERFERQFEACRAALTMSADGRPSSDTFANLPGVLALLCCTMTAASTSVAGYCRGSSAAPMLCCFQSTV
jgi:hypothetical protein